MEIGRVGRDIVMRNIERDTVSRERSTVGRDIGRDTVDKKGEIQ